MKISILFEFKDGPWGGANQFLKALRSDLLEIDRYEKKLFRSDVIIVNSHHFLKIGLFVKIIMLKAAGKKFIHRVDGPVGKVRGTRTYIDKLIILFNELCADATVFQSEWSRNECRKLGFKEKKHEYVIINAPDRNVFYSKEKGVKINGKIKIIATAWSPNRKKGFDYYRFLDSALDYNRYVFSFVGNSPVTFMNINHHKPENSIALGDLLRSHDIFITASEDDPCSNSLIEALHCGLPALGLNSGGHPEIIGENGLLFTTHEELIEAIETIAAKIDTYKPVPLPDIRAVSSKYSGLAECVNTLKSNRLRSVYYTLLAGLKVILLTLKGRREI